MRAFRPKKILENLIARGRERKLVGGMLIILTFVPLILLLLILYGRPPAAPSIEIDSAIWTLQDGTKMKFVIKKHIPPVTFLLIDLPLIKS